PNLEVTEGQVIVKGEDITEADTDERARMGLFMAFQYPVAVPGVTVTKYLRTVINAHRESRGEEPISLKEFRQTVEAAMRLTEVPREFSSRYLNEGFSGGEKKRMEILQLALQKPEMAILDETDSGLDIDALRVVSNGVNAVAGAQKPEVVLRTLDESYRLHNANIHRGVYTLAQEATERFEGARARIARFIGAPTAETIFTKNVTEAINLVAYSWGRRNVGAGDTIVLTPMEHHANVVAWQQLAQAVGARLAYVELTDDGRLDMDSFDTLLERGPKLVAVAHVSNVLGTLNPVEQIVERAHAAGAVVLIDGAQAVPHLRVDVRDRK